jgi:hypothetical protein
LGVRDVEQEGACEKRGYEENWGRKEMMGIVWAWEQPEKRGEIVVLGLGTGTRE